MLEIGYHYTSASNYSKILMEGLRPYWIGSKADSDQSQLEANFPGGVYGIWLWEQEPRGNSHTGNIIFQVSRKGEPKIVKLAVEYNLDDTLKYERYREVRITHYGHVGSWMYHRRDKSVIVVNAIPVNHIHLIGRYDITRQLAKSLWFSKQKVLMKGAAT